MVEIKVTWMDKRKTKRVIRAKITCLSKVVYGWVPYQAKVIDVNGRVTELEFIHPKRLENGPWIAYEALREYCALLGKLRFEKYEKGESKK